MDRQQIEEYLQTVAAYRASWLKANEWASANGVTVRQLASWCAHAERWKAKLDGIELEPRRRRSRNSQAGFVAAVCLRATATW